MPPAEWQWWNYAMVGGGAFFMFLSLSVLVSGVWKKLKRPGNEKPIQISARAGEPTTRVNLRSVPPPILLRNPIRWIKWEWTQRQLVLDLIPLIDGVDIARVVSNAELQSNPVVRSFHSGGEDIFKSIVFEMLGTDDSYSVPVYAVKPPMKIPEVIHDIYLKYKIGSDGTATHNMNPDDTLTNLKVRRSDVKRWMKEYLN